MCAWTQLPANEPYSHILHAKTPPPPFTLANWGQYSPVLIQFAPPPLHHTTFPLHTCGENTVFLPFFPPLFPSSYLGHPWLIVIDKMLMKKEPWSRNKSRTRTNAFPSWKHRHNNTLSFFPRKKGGDNIFLASHLIGRENGVSLLLDIFSTHTFWHCPPPFPSFIICLSEQMFLSRQKGGFFSPTWKRQISPLVPSPSFPPPNE